MHNNHILNPDNKPYLYDLEMDWDREFIAPLIPVHEEIPFPEIPEDSPTITFDSLTLYKERNKK